MKRRNFLKTSALTAVGLAAPSVVYGKEITLRFHSFLPSQAFVPSQIMGSFVERIAAATGERVKIEQYDALALGGTPRSMYEQAASGIVDMSLGLPRYTEGAFPRTSAFELPFMMKSAETTSRSLYTLVEEDLQFNEFQSAKILATWVHGPSVLHTNKPINSVEDLKGLKISTNFQVGKLLERLGATPVDMPVTAVPAALKKGSLDGASLPWEVAYALGMVNFVSNHTEVYRNTYLQTSSLFMAMNIQSYENLPRDIQTIMDQETGADLSAWHGKIMAEFDAEMRSILMSRGTTVNKFTPENVLDLQVASQPVYSDWISRMDARSIDGQKVLNRALSLTAKYS